MLYNWPNSTTYKSVIKFYWLVCLLLLFKTPWYGDMILHNMKLAYLLVGCNSVLGHQILHTGEPTWTIILILDSNTGKSAHIVGNLCYSIYLRHLIRLRVVTTRIFFSSEKAYLIHVRATSSELPSNISTMTWIFIWLSLYINYVFYV